ncbi:calpain family cysteine protease domain-containing protein [Ditylenchus destructor]|nr:calpain family cysteine protease domain-containing protein [Ditylenchus destructor]
MPTVVEEEFSKVKIDNDQFGGLVPNSPIGNFAGDIIRQKVGGKAGHIIGDLAGNVIGNLAGNIGHKNGSTKERSSDTSSAYYGNGNSYPQNGANTATYSPYMNSAGEYAGSGYQDSGYQHPVSNTTGYGYNPNAGASTVTQTIGFRIPETTDSSYTSYGNATGYHPNTGIPHPSAQGSGYNTQFPSQYTANIAPVPNGYQPYTNPDPYSSSQNSYQHSSTQYSSTFGSGYSSDYRTEHRNNRLDEGSFGSKLEGLIDKFASGSIHDRGRHGSFNVKDIIGSIAGGGSKGNAKGSNVASVIASLIGGGGDRGKYSGGGGNVRPESLKGGAVEIVGNLIGEAAHRFLGINPATGKILGSIAGNVIFHMGGKDNNLGNIGKVVLDNIISGKFHRKRVGSVQNFYTLREQCLMERRLFEDPEFPASDRSLYYSKRPTKRMEWLRPGEIVRDPQLITEGHSRFDVIQGELGDCWLMAAAANLTLRDELFYRVVPPDQSFTENYAGIFHFQFWQYGHWIDVVIDDRLPTYNGELIYMHSRENDEFWSALLEKAYAKLNGSYEALKGGTTAEALEDMTGGLTEFIDLANPPRNFLQMMMRGFEMGSLFACSIEADPYVWEARLANGLVKGHAYSITGMRVLSTSRFGRATTLIRLRNPWGNSQEWNGSWSDNSPEWRAISPREKHEMGLTFAHDGEFWMSFEDFMRNFEKMEICNLGPDVLNEVAEMTGIPRLRAIQQTWSVNSFHGSWRRGSSAGGCRNYLRTFSNNPQFWIRLSDSDPNDDDQLCTVIIAVMQKYRRELKHAGMDNLAIGFAMYETYGQRVRLTTDFFASTRSCARSPAFINLREVTGRFRVPPGEYVIVPSSYDPDEEADFMLRIFTNGLITSAAW